MAIGRKGSKIQKHLGMLVYSEPGCWKSSIGCEAIALKNADGSPMRVLFIDAECGGVDSALEAKAEQYGVSLDNSYVIYTESYSEIMGILDKVKKNEDFYYYDEDGSETDEVVLDAEGNPFRADFIVVDGSTVVYNASLIAKVKFSERRQRVKSKAEGLVGEALAVKVENANLELKDYNSLNKQMSQEFILKIISTGKHYYITARETDEKKTVMSASGKAETVLTGKKIPEGFKGMDYNVNTVMRLFVDKDDEFGGVKGHIVNKDRSGVHQQNEIIESPSLLDWQVVIDGNKGLKNVQVNPTFSDSIEKELQNNIQETHLEDKEILDTPAKYHEKIAAILKSTPATKKRTLPAKLKEKGLPKEYTTLTDIELLKTYIDIIS